MSPLLSLPSIPCLHFLISVLPHLPTFLGKPPYFILFRTHLISQLRKIMKFIIKLELDNLLSNSISWVNEELKGVCMRACLSLVASPVPTQFHFPSRHHLRHQLQAAHGVHATTTSYPIKAPFPFFGGNLHYAPSPPFAANGDRPIDAVSCRRQQQPHPHTQHTPRRQAKTPLFGRFCLCFIGEIWRLIRCQLSTHVCSSARTVKPGSILLMQRGEHPI